MQKDSLNQCTPLKLDYNSNFRDFWPELYTGSPLHQYSAPFRKIPLDFIISPLHSGKLRSTLVFPRSILENIAPLQCSSAPFWKISLHSRLRLYNYVKKKEPH